MLASIHDALAACFRSNMLAMGRRRRSDLAADVAIEHGSAWLQVAGQLMVWSFVVQEIPRQLIELGREKERKGFTFAIPTCRLDVPWIGATEKFVVATIDSGESGGWPDQSCVQFALNDAGALRVRCRRCLPGKPLPPETVKSPKNKKGAREVARALVSSAIRSLIA